MNFKKMRIFSGFLSPFVMCFLLSSCGNGPVSVAPKNATADAAAEATIMQRQEATQKLKARLQSFSKSLKPIEAVISDLVKALPKDTADSPEFEIVKRIQRLFVSLQQLLRESSRSWVTVRENGSWSADREFEIPGSRERPECKFSHVYLNGWRSADKDRFEVLLEDCAFKKPVKILSAAVAQESLEVEFNLDALQAIFDDRLKDGSELEFANGLCTLSIEKEGAGANLSCRRFTFNLGGKNAISAVADPLQVTLKNGVVRSSLQVDLLDSASKTVSRIQVDGSKFNICRKEKIEECPDLAKPPLEAPLAHQEKE